MLVYILKSTFCLVLLLGIYHFFLEKEKMHRFNRFYLLGSIIFSFLVPSFTIIVAPTITENALFTEAAMVNPNTTENAPQLQIVETINYTKYIIGLYILISSILLILLSKKVFNLLNKVRKNQHINYFSATVVLLKERIVPYTFLHYIFINKHSYQTDSLEEQILTHELAHVQQKHSIDVLFIEVLQNLFWFNPIFRYYKKAIQLNHEFLADDAVINSHKNITEYQQLLLSKTAQNNNIYLASNLNYSLTKKRLLMMTTPSSKTKILLKKLMVAPLVAGFVFAFAQRVEAQENNKNFPQIVETQYEENGISDKEMKEYKKLINICKTTLVFKQKEVSRMQNLYQKMSAKQQNTVESIFELAPALPPIKYKKKTPSVTQFNSWKNKEKFALWIDGKAVKNNLLNKYKNTDFPYYSGSFVYKNARSKRFPQEYQFSLYTKDFFLKMQKEQQQKNKNVVKILINKNGNLLVNNQATSLDNLENRLNKIISDKSKAHILINTDKETKKEDLLKVRKILKGIRIYKITINNKLLPPPPPIDLVYTYNRLVKKIQKTSKNRKANISYLKELYGKMSTAQKKKVVKPSRIPIRIQVVETKKKAKKDSKPQIREIKPVKIKVIEKKNKAKKTSKPQIREIIEEIEEVKEEVIEQTELIDEKELVEKEEVEIIEEIEPVLIEEIIESTEKAEVIEIIEDKKIQERVTIDKINSLTNEEIIDLNKIQNNNLKKIYYINNKKISEKKFKRLKMKQIKKMFIKRGKDNINHIYITLKK